jgi:small subunit ribosomal protein S17
MIEAKAKIIRTEVGRVVSDKMDKTIVVLIERARPHPLYKKYVKKSKKMHVHDEENTCHMGDLVRIREFRPISKKKSWILDVILEKKDALAV